MDIKEIFEGIAQKILIDFDRIQPQIDHAGERGRQRELVLRCLLEKYLPKKYSLGTGQVIDIRGNISRQCDIVIFDAFNCPLLLIEDGYQLFPAEAVFGVIEVKSIFNTNTIKECVQNIQSVKSLIRKEPIAGCAFAYRSEYSAEPKIETAAKALLKANQNIPPKEHIDLVCILSDGILRSYKGPPTWGEEGDSIAAFIELETAILAKFLFTLMYILEERSSSMPDLLGYTLEGKIMPYGVVRLFE